MERPAIYSLCSHFNGFEYAYCWNTPTYPPLQSSEKALLLPHGLSFNLPGTLSELRAPHASFCNTPEGSPHRPAKQVRAYPLPSCCGRYSASKGFCNMYQKHSYNSYRGWPCSEVALPLMPANQPKPNFNFWHFKQRTHLLTPRVLRGTWQPKNTPR